MDTVYHGKVNMANKQAKTGINPNKTRINLLTSIEIMAEEAAVIAGWKTVDFILAGVGATGIEDIPNSRLDDVFSQLQLIAEGKIY